MDVIPGWKHAGQTVFGIEPRFTDYWFEQNTGVILTQVIGCSVVLYTPQDCDVCGQWLDVVNWQTSGRWGTRFFEQVRFITYRRRVGKQWRAHTIHTVCEGALSQCRYNHAIPDPLSASFYQPGHRLLQSPQDLTKFKRWMISNLLHPSMPSFRPIPSSMR